MTYPKIMKAYRRKWAADRKLKDDLAKIVPINSVISYFHGKNKIWVIVLRHNGENLWVQGDSGKEYKISASRVESIYIK